MPSLWDSFSGAGAAKAVKAGQAESNALLTGGQQQATSDYGTGYTNAMSRIQPYMQGGQGAYNLYNDFMGVNGRPSQTNAMSNYQSSPYMSYLQQQGQRAVDRRSNASGGYYSGQALNAASQTNQDIASRDYNQYLSQLGQLGQQGQQMGQYGSQLDMSNANNLATLNYGVAQQKAGNAINASNALAQQNGTLWNNVMGLGSMAVSAMTGMPVGKVGTGGGQSGGMFGSMFGGGGGGGQPSYNNYASGWATPGQRY